MALPSVDFEYYSGTYGGWLTTEVFHEVLGAAGRQVRFVGTAGACTTGS